MKQRFVFSFIAVLALTVLAACNQVTTPTTFTVRIENISSAKAELATIFTPGVAVVGTNDLLFSAGQKDRGEGLEAIAETGNPAGYAEKEGYVIFNTPVGASEAGPAPAGKAYSFTIKATSGQNLAFATMFVESNDVFLSPAAAGIALFDDAGKPISGDVTSQLSFWDAGTEANEEPGKGPNQPKRQKTSASGEVDPNNTVRKVNDGFTYPDIAKVVKVTITNK